MLERAWEALRVTSGKLASADAGGWPTGSPGSTTRLLASWRKTWRPAVPPTSSGPRAQAPGVHPGQARGGPVPEPPSQVLRRFVHRVDVPYNMSHRPDRELRALIDRAEGTAVPGTVPGHPQQEELHASLGGRMGPCSKPW